VRFSKAALWNNALLILLLALGLFYYYRHFSERFGYWLDCLVDGGFFVSIAMLRLAFVGEEQIKRAFLKWCAKVLAKRTTRYAILSLLVVVVGLLLTTSSVVLSYDSKTTDPKPRFKLEAKAGGHPFRDTTLSIEPGRLVDSRAYLGLFFGKRIEFSLKEPPGGFESPRADDRWWSGGRKHYRAPADFVTPGLHLVFIVPGPHLMMRLPLSGTAATTYFLRIRQGKQEWTLPDFRKSVVVTGARRGDLPAQLPSAQETYLKNAFEQFGGIDERSLALLRTHVVPFGEPAFEFDKEIAIEAGPLNGAPLAFAQPFTFSNENPPIIVVEVK